MRTRTAHRWQGLETLEPRQLLAFALWDGGGGDGDWNNPLNWNSDTLPTASDNVVIDAPGSATIHSSHDVTIASLWTLDPIEISAGTFSVAGQWRQSAALSVTGGTITGAGNLVINGDVNWTGGEIIGAGKLLIYPGRTFTIDGDVTLGRELINNGSVVWESGNITTLSIGMRNLKDRTFTIHSSGSLLSQGDPSYFMNYGTFIRDGGAGTTTTFDAVFANGDPYLIIIGPWTQSGGIGPPFNFQFGTVDVRSGTLSFLRNVEQVSNGAINGASTWMVGAGAKLLMPGEPVQYASGTFIFDGAGSEIPIVQDVKGMGELRLLNGRVFNFSNLSTFGLGLNALTIDAPGQSLTIPTLISSVVTVKAGSVTFAAGLRGGTLQIDDGATVTLEGTSTFEYASISGGGLLKVKGVMNWSNGDISGPGQMVVTATGTLNLNSSWYFGGIMNLTRRLVNHGTINLDSFLGTFNLSAELVNRGTFNLRSSNGYVSTAGTTGFISNFGTINAFQNTIFRGAGGGVRVYNVGEIHAITGNLIFNGGTRGGGNWLVDPGYEVAFGGLGSSLEAALLSGGGKVRNAAAAVWSNVTMIGTGEFVNTPYGQLRIDGMGNSFARSVITNNGSIQLGDSASVVFDAPTTNNGMLDLGTGQLTVQGTFVSGVGTTVSLASGGPLAGIRLIVNGLANMTGSLRVSFTWPTPAGTVYQFMAATSRSSGQPTLSTFGLDPGLFGVLEYAGTIGRVRVVSL